MPPRLLASSPRSTQGLVQVYPGLGRDGAEGVRRSNVIGTYLHGPLLPKNVWLADQLVELALGIELEPLDDTLEDAAHGSARRAAGV